MAELDDIVGNARFVNVGEDSHGMPGVHQLVADSFKHLATTSGFRVFVFETAWKIDDVMQEFFDSDRVELNEEERWSLNAFDTNPTLDLLIWIREWNKNHPDDRIRVAGYQPEQPVTDFRALWSYLDALPELTGTDLKAAAAPCRATSTRYRSDADFVAESVERRALGQATYGASERAECLAAIAAIGEFLDANRETFTQRSSQTAFREARLRVLSLNAYVGTLTRLADKGFDDDKVPVAEQFRLQGETYGSGDLARYQIWETLQDTRYSGRKVFFWMHNWHAAEHAAELNRTNTTVLSIPAGTVSLGERLAERYGHELVTIGSVVPCDTTCTEPTGSLEPRFAEEFGKTTTVVDLRRPGDAATRLPLSAPGWLYANHHETPFADVVLDRQYDALLYMPPELAGKVGH